MHVIYFFLVLLELVIAGGLLYMFFESGAAEKALFGIFMLVLILIPIAGIVLIVMAFINDAVGLAVIGVILLIFGGAFWSHLFDR